jgi:uncharacterized OsmC-like protein
MTADELRSLQAPVKARYKDDPASALATLRAEGTLQADNLLCLVPTFAGIASAGLHRMTGGDGRDACAADMLLQALVACAGVTLRVVATALGIAVRGGTVRAEGVLDFRGTLGVSKDVPIGFREIRLHLDPDCDATPEQRAKLLQLTERYCVVYQTLKSPPVLTSTISGLEQK